MGDYGKGGKKGGRGKGKKGEQDYDPMGYGGDKGYRQPGKGGGAAANSYGANGGKPSKDVADQVHHYPPKEMAADVGYPVRGGQTLLIAYFPWEASEADIEREFSKVCRVKRVHLVVDKSSRKPRCFGFVKFLSKADAEEALRATTQGLVQLPDTRGHVWHLKAEWTKSGDMVVDDSEAEQEVAKRKEERRSRTDPPLTGSTGLGKPSGPPPKGALHPGVPAPLPPLQTRYPPQAGLPPPPVQHQPGMAHAGLPPQQPLPPQYGGQPMYGSGHNVYGGQSALYGGLTGGVPVGPALGRDAGTAAGAIGPNQDAPGLPSTSAAAAPPPLLRDLGGYAASAYPGASGYAAAVAAAAAQQASGYPPAQPQSYVGQQGYGASQSPYVSSQQAYAAGQQAAYAAGQQAYQTAAATASGAGQPPGYGSQLHGYPPQAQSAGYGAPPGYGAYTQQATSYPANPATAYATAGYGLGQSAPSASAYNYLQQPTAQSSGVVAYGSYATAGASQVQPLQHHQQPIMPTADPSRPQDHGAVAVANMPAHQAGPMQPQHQVYQTQPAPMTSDPSVATASLAQTGPVDMTQPQQSQQQYLDMVWNMSDMSLNEKQTLPAPPAQQPPAPPAGHIPATFGAGTSVPAGVSKEWETAPRPGAPATASAVWNSFDDAAAKGMVDGLVGDDSNAPPSIPPPLPTTSNPVWGSH
mmetsp:Transcript_101230/g.179820  ORF Transcript_101230/g.179820 Transcript_101230/m.179820 type:complete len:694 (-) Transcript_101230:74-2155(-)